MSKNQLLWISFIMIAGILSGCSRSVSFQDSVLPILQESCVQCHNTGGEGIKMTGLVLKDYDGVMKGTKLGPVVVPGSAESSTLYLVISHKVDSKIQMPPHHSDKYPTGEGKPLTPEQIQIFEEWINEGAQNN